jgi:hypothetical protein
MGTGQVTPSGGGGIDPPFEKKKTDAEIGAIDAPKKVGKRLEVRFNRHERVKSALSEKEVLFKGGAKKVREKNSVRGGGRRDATEKGTRMRSFPNPDGSERKRAGSIRMNMGTKEGLPRGRRNVRRLEGRDLERAKLDP